MEMLLILTYGAICLFIFKVFRVPVNKWTVPSAVLGGVVAIFGAGAVALPFWYKAQGLDAGELVVGQLPAPQDAAGVLEDALLPRPRLRG